MTRKIHAHLTPEEFHKLAANPPQLLAKLELRMFVFDSAVRSELWQLRRDQPGSHHLVWQHRNEQNHSLEEAQRAAPIYLGLTAAWLVEQQWPGVQF